MRKLCETLLLHQKQCVQTRGLTRVENYNRSDIKPWDVGFAELRGSIQTTKTPHRIARQNPLGPLVVRGYKIDHLLREQVNRIRDVGRFFRGTKAQQIHGVDAIP